MFRTFANAWKIKELRNKILFTLAVLFIYRIGANIFVPFVSRDGVLSMGGTTAFNIFNVLSGGAAERMTLFALGVSPYITASIVVQLLSVAIPALERLSKMGDEGKNKINTITRYITIVISVIMAIGYYMMIKSDGLLGSTPTKGWMGFFYAVVIVASFCAGSSIVMWLAEKINDKGIGNGISLILFANIISTLPNLAISMFQLSTNNVTTKGSSFMTIPGFNWRGTVISLLTIVVILLLVWFIIFVSDSERRIPVQYAKKVVGRKMYGGQNSNLPIKVNMTGVMPIIFANAIMSVPGLVAQFMINSENETVQKVALFMSGTGWIYVTIQFILVLAFAYFYVAISFNPTEVAGNLQKNGGSIPGIRPGKATSDYISKVLSRVTLIGALTLSVISIVPHIVVLILNYVPADGAHSIVDIYSGILSPVAFAGTSIIIAVGVILETIREIEAQMTMRHYKGFLE
ncbi:MAG: preprotein translocase subunit SecY [Clostridia bacterium]|nr:preprotein translocase subunit SecY [Clostridia bacterium]